MRHCAPSHFNWTLQFGPISAAPDTPLLRESVYNVLYCTVFEDTCSQIRCQNGGITAPLTREYKSFCVDVPWNCVHEKWMPVLQFLTGTQSPLRSCRRANHTTLRERFLFGPSAIQVQSRSDAISVPYNPVGFSTHFSELLLLKSHCLFTALQSLV